MLYGKKPSLEGLPVWGCKDKVHDMSSLKLDIWAHKGHWVGYDPQSNGHRI